MIRFRIPELLDWCDRLASKIASGRDPITGCGIDFPSAGEDLQQLPAGIISMNWSFETYRNYPLHFTADRTVAWARATYWISF